MPNFSPEYEKESEHDQFNDDGSIRYGETSTTTAASTTTRNMPRLEALRERLRLEKLESANTGVRAAAAAAAAASNRDYSIRNNPSSQSLPNSPSSNQKTPSPYPVDNTMVQQHYNTTNTLPLPNNNNVLTDTHNRHHNYLRISLSERCNLRCQYCMPPEGIPLSPPSHLLTNEEILRLVRVFVKNGVNKVRLTGGEPLLRKDLVELVGGISRTLREGSSGGGGTAISIPDPEEGGLVGITTNGISLSRNVRDLVQAGLTGVNISLDTLRDDRFVEITRRKGLERVLRSIRDSIDAFRDVYGDVRLGRNGEGGSRVKVNCVVMKNFNDDEMIDFVNMANETFGGDIDMRFIEWMPFNDNGWNRERFVSYKDMMERIASGSSRMRLERIGDGPNDTTKWWRAVGDSAFVDGQSCSVSENNGRSARIGFITSMSEHFCSTCNRLRITADGKIKVCLFGSNEKEVSLREILRSHGENNMEGGMEEEEALSRVIHAAVQKKTFALGGHGSPDNIAKAADNRPMTLIGG